jgi:DNA polymerase III subunit beta
MKFSISRDMLLAPLQQVIGVIEKRQTMAILSNVLIKATEGSLGFTGTDLEVQLITKSDVEWSEPGEITVPARKLLDICRTLPESSVVRVEGDQDRMIVQCGRSRFNLNTLPANSFPAFELGSTEFEASIEGRVLKKAFEKTIFAMAVQDVRYYLNGLMLEFNDAMLRVVSSDGHRLAVYEATLEHRFESYRQVIIPRKGVSEFFRLLGDDSRQVSIQLGSNSILFELGHICFSAKLIEARFPDFERVMPRDISRVVTVNKEAFRGALSRVSILSNEKLKGVSLDIGRRVMRLTAHNPEHEEAEEELEVNLNGEEFTIGFNAAYLLDALNNVDSDEVKLSFTDAATSCLIEDVQNSQFRFIVMPMRL